MKNKLLLWLYLIVVGCVVQAGKEGDALGKKPPATPIYAAVKHHSLAAAQGRRGSGASLVSTASSASSATVWSSAYSESLEVSGAGLGGIRLPRLVTASSRPSTPGSVCSTATSFGCSLASSPLSCGGSTGRARHLLKSAGAVVVAVGRRRQLSAADGRKFLDAVEKEGVVVSMPRLEPSADELAGTRIAAFWECSPDCITTAYINPRWLALRYRILRLRERLFSFRLCYTKASNHGMVSIASFLKSCDECKRAVDGAIDYFSDQGLCGAQREVEGYYALARDLHNFCLPLAESLFMGINAVFENVYSTATPFGETHLYPRDGVALRYLKLPLCISCSEREGKKVQHPNFTVPRTLEFEDVCPSCEKSFLDLLRQGNVYVARDNRVEYNPVEQLRILSELTMRLTRAEKALLCILCQHSDVL